MSLQWVSVSPFTSGGKLGLNSRFSINSRWLPCFSTRDSPSTDHGFHVSVSHYYNSPWDTVNLVWESSSALHSTFLFWSFWLFLIVRCFLSSYYPSTLFAPLVMKTYCVHVAFLRKLWMLLTPGPWKWSLLPDCLRVNVVSPGMSSAVLSSWIS